MFVMNTNKTNQVQPEDSAIVGPKTPRSQITYDPAEASSLTPQPGSFVSGDVFGLLVRALVSMNERGLSTRAAGVSAQMRVFEPNFSPQGNGFPNFRALLEAAKTKGLVLCEAQTGGSDILVKLVVPGLRKAGSESPFSELTRVKTDLWRGFLDWSAEAVYYFERNSGRTVRFAGESATSLDDTNRVRVKSVSRDEQLSWMKEFAAVDPQNPTRDLLASALQGDEAIRAFSGALKSSPASAKRWKKFLRSKVLQKMQDWAEANGISTNEIEIAPVVVSAPSPEPQEGVDVNSNGSDSEMRERILAVFAAMPLHELLKLPVPLEYSLRV